MTPAPDPGFTAATFVAAATLLLAPCSQAARLASDDSAVGNPLAGRAQLGNIAPMGHSRGAETVAQAAALNEMERCPDGARVKLGFGYDIRAIVAIAPVDGQYRPAGRLVTVKGVSYLALHGLHDGGLPDLVWAGFS